MLPVRTPNEYHLYNNPATSDVSQLQTFAAPFTAAHHQMCLQNTNPMEQMLSCETETNYGPDTDAHHASRLLHSVQNTAAQNSQPVSYAVNPIEYHLEMSYYPEFRPESTSTFATNHYHSHDTFSSNNVANRVMNPTNYNPNCCEWSNGNSSSRNNNTNNSWTHYQPLQPQHVCTCVLCVRHSAQQNHNHQLQSMQMQSASSNQQIPQNRNPTAATAHKQMEADNVKAQNEAHPERKHICKQCGKRYKHLCNLKSHAKMHTDEALICPYCKKRFGRKSNYKEHLRVHTGEKPFECEYCLRKFAHHHSWKDHLRIHTGERPYKCNVCGKKFKVGHNLTVHLRIHSKEKPYKCKICCKSFRQKSAINTHIKRVHSADTNAFIL